MVGCTLDFTHPNCLKAYTLLQPEMYEEYLFTSHFPSNQCSTSQQQALDN